MVEKTFAKRVKEDDVRLYLPRRKTRYAKREWFDEDSCVTEGKYAITFSHTSTNGPTSLNDRTDFLTELSSSKSTMAVIVDSVTQFLNLYKYSRTKLFSRLIEGRISSHDTYLYTYQDIPWWFNFDESDPVEWGGSIEELDLELERYLGLEEHHDYIQSASKPFASELDSAAIERLVKELGQEGGGIPEGLGKWE